MRETLGINAAQLEEFLGHCGSCWAFGAVESLSDCFCIHYGLNNSEDLYSPFMILACPAMVQLGMRPYENGDQRDLKLIKAILRPLVLRTTKDTKDKDGSLPPVSHAQFPILVDMPQHASGPTLGQQHPNTSNIHFLTPQYKITTCSARPTIYVFAAPLPSEAPAFNVNPTVMIPYSTSDPVLNIFSDQYYAPEPIFKSISPYDCPQLTEFPPNTEKPVMTEEQEEMTRKLRSLELIMRNLQGLGGYKSVSDKDLCMFPGVHLPLGFKMPKFEKYDGHGNPVSHLRRYCNQLRGVGGKEELLMAYFGESLSGLASEWFVDQDIDKWISWDDLANRFVQKFQYNVELIPNEKSLTSIKKKNIESFREYAIRWCEQAARVKLPMKESKIVEVFIQAQDETYYQNLLPTLGKPFIEVLKMGDMIEDGIKTGRIVSFATLKATTQAIQKGLGSVGGKKNEVDAYAIIVGQQARARGLYHHYPRAQTQVYSQVPQNPSQNPLYSIPPSSYQVYNAQLYVQPPSYPHWHEPTLLSYPPTPYTYRSPSRPGF
ncbi:hypothetical protein T459_03259 [Capsicum annuum]|uniref:Retrotransposon gag domain-containing protein n=1 Tax=Capsicum annuum TaxID=4072 RepID=A0A2G3AMB1_CAPAN|nr:hypothetical protein T459_03259 [Capsicum annuum]